jgi:hypothetical protein
MRTILREALKAALEKTYDMTFDFGMGFLDDINGGGYKLPCVWVCPFDLVGKTGRSEGFKIYAGTVYLLELSDGLTSEKKDERWDDMERAAVEAFSEMAETLGVTFDKINAFPNEGTYTGYNDISLKVTFEVMTSYCENRG